MTIEEINIGDIVKLNVGGPVMRVIGGGRNGKVRTAWIDNNNRLIDDEFVPGLLRRVPTILDDATPIGDDPRARAGNCHKCGKPITECPCRPATIQSGLCCASRLPAGAKFTPLTTTPREEEFLSEVNRQLAEGHAHAIDQSFKAGVHRAEATAQAQTRIREQVRSVAEAGKARPEFKPLEDQGWAVTHTPIYPGHDYHHLQARRPGEWIFTQHTDYSEAVKQIYEHAGVPMPDHLVLHGARTEELKQPPREMAWLEEPTLRLPQRCGECGAHDGDRHAPNCAWLRRSLEAASVAVNRHRQREALEAGAFLGHPFAQSCAVPAQAPPDEDDDDGGDDDGGDDDGDIAPANVQAAAAFNGCGPFCCECKTALPRTNGFSDCPNCGTWNSVSQTRTGRHLDGSPARAVTVELPATLIAERWQPNLRHFTVERELSYADSDAGAMQMPDKFLETAAAFNTAGSRALSEYERLALALHRLVTVEGGDNSGTEAFGIRAEMDTAWAALTGDERAEADAYTNKLRAGS